MAWQDVIPEAIRVLLADTGNVQTYTEQRLELSATVAALIVAQELPYPGILNQYTIDMSTPDILPDPVLTNDNVFVSLILLKATCIINQGQWTGALGNAVRIRDGTSAIDTVGSLKGFADIIKLGACASYAALLKTLQARRSVAVTGAVLSPYGKSQCAPWGNEFSLGNLGIRSYFDQTLNWWY